MKFLPRPRIRFIFRRYHGILLGSLVLSSATVTPASWEPPMLRYPRPEVKAPPSHPWVAFTFDDGPHPELTEKLLAVLREQDVPATFFVVGKMVERYPYLVQQIARDGHELANHTFTHPRLTRLEDQEVLKELTMTRTAIRRITGKDTLLYRPPGGDYTRATVRVASKAGYKMVLWSVLSNDVVGASRAKMMKRIMTGVDDGGIILMHSGVKSTIEILPDVIKNLRKKGYQFVTVSTVLGLPSDDAPYGPRRDETLRTAALPKRDLQ